jgi:hypothetical protein
VQVEAGAASARVRFRGDTVTAIAALANISQSEVRAPETGGSGAHREVRRRSTSALVSSVLHLPTQWPWADAWLALWRNVIKPHPPPHCIAA